MTATCYFVSFITAAVIFSCAQAQFRLSNAYGNGMVLQMEPKSSHVWGYGEVGATVIVSLGSQSYNVTVDDLTTWSIRLPPQPAGGPHVLTVEHVPVAGFPAGGTQLFDVMFGDVWVCGGETNMELPMKDITNGTEEIEKSLSYKQIRLFKLAKTFSYPSPTDDIIPTSIFWSNPTIENVSKFSALCLLYGERLADKLGDRPLALIDVSYSATPIEAWSSPEATLVCETPSSPSIIDEKSNNVLWNGMIYPLTKMAVRGAIWHQGESNPEYNRELYPCHFKNLVQDWRNSFLDGTVSGEDGEWAFPFGFVQLGPVVNPAINFADDVWGRLRWLQTIDAGFAPNPALPDTFMAPAYDLTEVSVDDGDVRFFDKQTVATRLANAAKNYLYKEPHLASGLLVVRLAQTEDPSIISLEYNAPIEVSNYTGFSYERPDGSWEAAVVVYAVEREVLVRVTPDATRLSYAWKSAPCAYQQCSIYSADQDHLPAAQFFWDIHKGRH